MGLKIGVVVKILKVASNFNMGTAPKDELKTYALIEDL